jgi:hypothetical protein
MVNFGEVFTGAIGNTADVVAGAAGVGGRRVRKSSVKRRPVRRRSRGGNQVQEDFNEQVAMDGGAKRRRRVRRKTRGGYEVAAPDPMKMAEKKEKVQEMMSVEQFALFGGAHRRKAKKVSGDSKIKKMLKVEKMAKAKVVKAMKVATKAAKVARSARISINKMKAKKSSH